MKIDIESLRPCNADILPRCMQLIEHIKSAPDEESFFTRLVEVHEWQPQFGKSEMARWADVLNMCDEVLERAVAYVDARGVLMSVDADPLVGRRVAAVLSFTALLFENTFTRSIYSSADRLLNLLQSGNMEVVVETLRLLQVISKRSRFLSQHLSESQQKQLTMKLTAIVQCWSGKLRNSKMDECCSSEPWCTSLLPICYQVENSTKLIRTVQLDKSLAVEMDEVLLGERISEEERISLCARMRLVRAFCTVEGRRMCVVARLLALSVLVYSRTLLEEWQLNSMLYDNLVEEISRLLLVDIAPSGVLVDTIKTEALKTLTSIISLDRPAKQNVVVECLGANSYHGFMARAVRVCVEDLRRGTLGTPGHTSVQFCTALFSLLYHLAGFDNGGEALVSCALTESLLSVVACESVPLEQISFATRAVRVLDIMTSLDANAFTAANGMNIVISRLAVEVKECQKAIECSDDSPVEPCHQQRAALIKSLLNFIKRAVQDSQFADSVRHLMDGPLPSALIQIISRCDFFGASLFHNAVGLVTNFIYQEPSLLTTIQDKGVTSAIMDAVFHKELPSSRDVLSALPNTFTALCLNERGLHSFIAEDPFEHLCTILLSTKFISAMKRRRNEMNEAAVSLGSALDDLLRHQPTLRPLLLNSIVKMLDRLVEFTSCEQPRCVMSLSSNRSVHASVANASNATVAAGSPTHNDEHNVSNNNDTSDEDDDDPPSAAPNMEEMSPISERSYAARDLGLSPEAEVNGENVLPLGEYLLNVSKLLETLLTQSASSEHAEAFVRCGAANRLIALLFVRQIPLEVSQSVFPQLISNILRYLYQQTRSDEIIESITQRLQSYCEQIVALCRTQSDNADQSTTAQGTNGCASLLLDTPVNQALPLLCAISVFSSLLTNLSKMAFGVNPSLRTTVLKYWTNGSSGSKLMAACHHVQRILAWESAVLQAFNSVIRVSSATQTEEIEEVDMGTPRVPCNNVEENTCGSVGAESVPRKSTSCPLYLQKLVMREDSWLRTKWGVTALGRCQRQLGELMAMLAKVCTWSSPRRRTNESLSVTPDKNAIWLALRLLSAHKVALGWQPKESADPAVLLPYLSGWITSLSGILFDERRMPYHVLLSAFYYSGCHNAYFSLIMRHISLQVHRKHALEVEQLLQAWLLLTERLVNADAFNHSRHRLSQHCEEAKRFPAQKYLILCQQDALYQVNAIFALLNSSANAGNANVAVCELTVSLYKQLIKGLIPSAEPGNKVAVSADERNKLIAELDEASINFLVDMGFERDTVIEALFEYATVEEATDFLVANDRQQHASANDSRIDELEDAECAEMSEEKKEGESDETEHELQDEPPPPPLSEVTPLDVNAVLKSTCTEIIPTCMEMVQFGVELVFNTSELILAIVNDISAEWRSNVLVKEYFVDDVVIMLQKLTMYPVDDGLVHSLSTRLHLCCLLWAAIANEYLVECANCSLQCMILSVLELTASTQSPSSHTLVKLIAPVCLWLDLYEKMLTMKCNKSKMENVVESLTWKYWDTDERGGAFTWVNYRPASSHTLTRAFYEGNAGANLSIAGKHYAVSFVTMSQRNVESHVERPITVVARVKEDADIDQIFKPDKSILEWNEVVRTRMVPVVISLMGTAGLDSNAVHALLILAARITRNAEIAAEMLRGGGVQAIVNVVGSPMATRALLVALVVRHCLDDETSLCQIFEKTIRTVAAGGYSLNPPSSRWHHRMPRTTRDWLHAMRALAPLCARHPRLFLSTMERVARKQNGQITAIPVPPSDGGPKSPPPSAPVRQVVQQLMGHVMDFSWEDNNRVVTRASLIRLIAELVKSYSAVATLVAESQHVSAQSALVTLLDRCILPLPDADSGDSSAAANELLTAVKSLVVALASCNHSPKAQEALVTDLGTALRLALADPDSKTATMKIKALCDMVVLARDVCPSGGHEARATGSLHSQLNPILRLLLKKRICIELAKVPWHLNLSTKDGIDALNHVLKTLDELTRSINSAANGAQAEGATGTRASSQNASATLTLSSMPTNDVGNAGPTITAEEAAPNGGTATEDHHAQQQQHSLVGRMLEGFDEGNEEPQAETEEDSTETDEEEEENADEEMEFEDDEGGANEIDIEEEESDEEEERDDEAMQEEGQESDEEDDFGLIEMADESVPIGAGRRFEDGDPDNTFIDANVFLENLDDTDRIGSYEFSRPDRLSAPEVALHPLMQRPAIGAETSGLRSNGYRFTISGRRPGTVTAPGLHRQGAVRRWGTVGPQRDFLERLIESGTVANATHLFDVLPSRQRLFNIILHESASEAINTALGEERRHATVPSPLERFTEAAHVIDAHSHFYIWLVAANHITTHLDAIEKKEKEEKEKLESKKKAEEEDGAETKEGEVKEATDEEAHTANASDTPPTEQMGVSVEGHDVAVESAEPAVSEVVAENAGNDGVEEELHSLNQQDTVEPMDTTDSGTVFFDARENLESGSCGQQENMIADANVPGDDANAETANATESNEMIVSTPPHSPHQDGGGEDEQAPVSNAVDEYRDILGDIEVPEGVDPAFLAALPEDIRAEVIRDHQRQQRAQRLAQSVGAAGTGAEGAASGEEAAAAGGASAPGVEPLDQEFLNALPPELQEEILAQHERTLRLAAERAQNAAGSSSTPGGEPPSTEGDDAAALIESLPPSLRAQVLADADDTVLQVLPQSVAAEARRLRANLEQQQVMRFARMLAPGRFQRMMGRGSTLAGSSAQLGALAGATTLASKSATQLLDRDALVTLVMLFFVDPARLNTQRLQKVLRSVCAQSATCDFVVWCLVAVLDKITSDSSRYEDFAGSSAGWIDNICVPSALGHHERAIKFFKNSHSVLIHPAVAASSTRIVLEMLTSLARAYPGHFVPAKLRVADSTPSVTSHSHPLSQFWHIVHSLSKGDGQQLRSGGHRHSTGSSSTEFGSSQGSVSASLASATLEESAVGLLMAYLNRPVVRSSSQLQDKLLRLICTIVQTLPDDTVTKLSIDEKAERPPLSEQLDTIVMVLTEGKCSEEGLVDGRTLLMEAIRALTPSTRTLLHSLFISAAERLGQRLLPLLAQLHDELAALPVPTEDPGLTLAAPPSEPSTSRRTALNRYDESTIVIDGVSNWREVLNASGCDELQLPAVRALTEKHGVQNTLLRTLHTIIKMKDALNANAKKKQEENNSQENQTAAPNDLKEEEERLSVLLSSLEPLWELVSACLQRLAKADAHAALALQPAAEAFFLVHGSALSNVDPNKHIEHPDAVKLVQFAEKHRSVLNQVLRQSGNGLSDGPFSILVQMPKLLDFDVKRKYFRKQMQRLDGPVRGEDVAVRIRRSHLFSDSFRELFRLRGPEWKARFYIIFEGEEGQDAGGLLREWFSIITREIFNPNYALFITAPGDRVTYMINKASYINPEHLEYFKFVGRIIAKAIYENKLLDCYFTRAFYKHILTLPVRAQDLESEDPSFYKSLEFLLNNPIEELGTELTFSVEVEEFGVRKMRELKEDGASIPVTDENKEEYVKLVCQMKMTGSINQQLSAFLEGFYEIIPKQLISMFNEQELELLISGLPSIDIDDLYANTEYKTYSKTSPQIQWFWKALRSFEQEDRAKFLQFVTGTSKVPLQGFASLEGMNGVQKFSIHMDSRSNDRLPAAHTCFNQLDLPQYESYEKLRDMLLLAVRECTEGFGFA